MATPSDTVNELARKNALYAGQLLESLANHNDAEVCELSESAIRWNLELLQKAVAQELGDYAPELHWARKVNDSLRAVVLVSKIELHERIVAGEEPWLPKGLAPWPEGDGALQDRFCSECSESSQWLADLRELLTILTSAGGLPTATSRALSQYLVARAFRAQSGPIRSTVPGGRFLEGVERCWRAMAYAVAGACINGPSIEADLLVARLHRDIGLRTYDLTQFEPACRLVERLLLPSSLKRFWEDEVERCEGPRDRQDAYELVTSYVPRALNDLGNLVEVIGRVCELTSTGPSLDRRQLDNHELIRSLRDLVQTHYPIRGVQWDKTEGILRSVVDSVREIVDEWSAMVRDHVETVEPGETGPDLAKDTSDEVMQSTKWVRRLTSELVPFDERREVSRHQWAYHLAIVLFSAVDHRDTQNEMVPPWMFVDNPAPDWGWNYSARIASAINNRGRLRAQLNDVSAAARDYVQALEVDPDLAVAHENLGLLLIQSGQYRVAERHFALARKFYEEHSNVRTMYLEASLGDVVLAQETQKAELAQFLNKKPTLKDSPDQLVIAKRWNSFTPTIPRKRPVTGGGYFLVARGIGIAIDPGYGFLQNIGEAGFSISDIQVIVISHTHMDHIADLEDMLLLLFERRKRLGLRSEALTLVAGSAVVDGLRSRLKALAGAAPEKWSFLRIVVPPGPDQGNVSGEYTWSQSGADHRDWQFTESDKPSVGRGIVCRSTTASHSQDRHSTKDPSCGYVFEWKTARGIRRIGYTGDSRWVTGLSKEFHNCHILLAHLGSIYPDDIDHLGDVRPAPASRRGTHLGLGGLYNLVAGMPNDARPGVMVVGEFGEELSAARTRVVQKLNHVFSRLNLDTLCITGDLGLRIKLSFAPNGEDSDPAKRRFSMSAGARRSVLGYKCQLCGSNSWRPIEVIREMVVDANSADGGVTYYCDRHLSTELEGITSS